MANHFQSNYCISSNFYDARLAYKLILFSSKLMPALIPQTS